MEITCWEYCPIRNVQHCKPYPEGLWLCKKNYFLSRQGVIFILFSSWFLQCKWMGVEKKIFKDPSSLLSKCSLSNMFVIIYCRSILPFPTMKVLSPRLGINGHNYRNKIKKHFRVKSRQSKYLEVSYKAWDLRNSAPRNQIKCDITCCWTL